MASGALGKAQAGLQFRVGATQEVQGGGTLVTAWLGWGAGESTVKIKDTQSIAGIDSHYFPCHQLAQTSPPRRPSYPESPFTPRPRPSTAPVASPWRSSSPPVIRLSVIVCSLHARLQEGRGHVLFVATSPILEWYLEKGQYVFAE